MSKAKMAVFSNPSLPFELEYCEIPELKSGEVLVEISCTCLCSSDLHTYSGRRKEKSPTILGHEITGIVQALPENEELSDLNGQTLKIGDRLTWAIYSSEPNTRLSQIGIPQKSDNLFKYGHEQLTDQSKLHGGLASHIIIRKNTPLLIVNSDIPDALLALVNCSVSTVAGAIRLAGPLQGKKVLVSGVGMLGIVACAMAHAQGATVLATDISANRLFTAQKFGALPFDYLQKVDCVLEFSGSKEAMEKSIECLEIGGVAVWVGATFPTGMVQINPEFLIRNLITIKGLHNYNEADFKNALKFMVSFYKEYPFFSLLKEGFNLDEINEAFQYAEANKPYRLAIRM
jgi:putative phosphonate catabolism associated alcohol dehydrogenase